ncbi:hypothetical protein F5Y16DRAFT_397367 [Xylariaceae sp. FL0255]|nr:hypothetical protein F5Y16DRAFT_397367 [Xylariaceae sp. FL0255]
MPTARSARSATSAPATTVTSFQSEDTDLFENDALADALIICNGKQWKLHKEAQTSELEFKDQDPEVLDWVFRWIYTGKLDTAIFSNSERKYLEYARLYELADFLLLDKLKKDCKDGLSACLESKSIAIQKRFHDVTFTNRREQYNAKDLAGYIAGVAQAYKTDTLAEIRDLNVRLISHCHYWILHDRVFNQLAETIPTFWIQVKEMTFQAFQQGSLGPCGSPVRCFQCGKTAWTTPGFEWAKIECVADGVYGYCNTCRPRSF